MFNPTDLSPQQKQQLIAYLRQTRTNPLAMLKLKTLRAALDLQRFVKTNAPQAYKDFNVMFQAFQNQVTKLFQESEDELLKKLGA